MNDLPPSLTQRIRDLTATAGRVLAQCRQVPGRVWLAGGVLAALLGVAFHMPVEWMIDRWMAPDTYYSHGFFVPLVAGWLLWRDRAGLREACSRGYGWGLLAMLAGLFVLLVSGLQTIFFTGAFALLVVAWGLAGFLFGWRVMGRLLFPLFVLCFMVPLPLATIEEVSFKLKMLATQAAVGLTDAVGIIALNEGSKIYLENGASLTVGNACSGLRSLIAFLFLGMVFAYLSDFSWPRRILLFAATVPIALAANILRVFGLCLVANFWGEQAVEGAVHDSSGYMVFIVAFFMLYGVERLLGWRRRPAAAAGASAPPEPPTPAPGAEPAIRNPLSSTGNLKGRTAFAIALLALSAWGSWLVLYPTLMEQSHKAGALPLTMGGWSGYDAEVPEYVKQILETEDVVERNYISPAWSATAVQLAVSFSSNNRRVAHPPEICYRAGGWEVIDKRIMQYAGLPPLMRLILDNGNKRRDVVYYVYKSGPHITANYYQQQFNIALNQILRRANASSLIRFSSTIRPNEDQATTEQRLLEFIALMMPEVRKFLN